MKNFIGQDGFVWWIGKVVDIDDPLSLGRCRVRIFGYHGEERDVPDEDLPWAVAIHPINTPNFYGTPRIGYFVFGFFLDASSAQEPAMLGYFPAIPEAGTRNFANITSKEDVLLDINGAKISISKSGVVKISSTNNIEISTDSDIVFKSSGVNTITLSTIVNSIPDIAQIAEIESLVQDVYDSTNSALTLITGVSEDANDAQETAEEAFSKANTAFILS